MASEHQKTEFVGRPPLIRKVHKPERGSNGTEIFAAGAGAFALAWHFRDIDMVLLGADYVAIGLGP